MPVIRVSNEAYRTLLRLQAEDGNTMSVFLDRFFAKYEPVSKPVSTNTPKAKTIKKPKKRMSSSKKKSLPGLFSGA